MTQDEKWQARYEEIVEFINRNHRNPSKLMRRREVNIIRG